MVFQIGISGFQGRSHSEETKKKIIRAKIGKTAHNKGKRNKTHKIVDVVKRNWVKNRRNRLKSILNNQGLGHTYGEWELLKKQYNYTCPCCNLSEPEIKLTEDHIIPLSKGGSDLIENLQPLCLKCNMKKHTKIIKY